MPDRAAVVANTDERWFSYLRSLAIDGRLDEVNFWRPLGTAFRALSPGEPFFFRLKSPINAVVGYGYFAHFSVLPVGMAWDAFGVHNGDANFQSFTLRIAAYRAETSTQTATGNRALGCIVLREVQFLSERD